MSFSLKSFGAASLASVLLATSTGAFAQAKKPAQPAPAQVQAPAQPAPVQPAPNQPASPQQQAPQGPIRLDLVPTQNDWTKVCGRDQAANKDICYTTRDFSAQAGQAPVLALAVYDIKGDDTRIIRLLVPVGLMLRPGFRFSVDKGPTLEGAFEICFPNGCFAEAKVKGQTIDQLKKGSILSVAVKNQANNEVTFDIPVAGFGRAFDGPPIDPKVLEEQQRKLQEELQKRAEEERKRLEATKQGQGTPAAPAPAAPATPAK
ncbi:MAG TPA: invasion associated locus B family protein [Methylocella sp.]|nr:invasion associated locus B family protein [Methylocella sp.]